MVKRGDRIIGSIYEGVKEVKQEKREIGMGKEGKE